MSSGIWIAIALLMQSAGGPLRVAVGRFGDVNVHRPSGPPREVVLLLSDREWTTQDDSIGAELARRGTLVLGIDSLRYVRLASPRGCSFVAADLETLSQRVQRELGVERYMHPVVVGLGSGGRLAYAALAEAPPDTFRGAVSAGFCPRLSSAKMICRGVGLKWKKPVKGDTVELLPSNDLGNPWIVLPAPSADCTAAETRGFVDATPNAELRVRAAHETLPAALDAAIQGVERLQPEVQAERGPLPDLPLIELGAKSQSRDVIAVILSGDGGWVSLDRKIGRRLAEHGVGVVGIDALQYFWNPRTPESSSADLARILRHYFQAWNKHNAIVIGYSQGADVVPFMASRLPADLRPHVKLVAIIGSDGAARFDRNLDGAITGRERREDLPVLPEIARLKDMHPVCVYGSAEKETLCHDLEPGEATLLELAGGHTFSGDGAFLAESFLYEAGFGPKPEAREETTERHGKAPPKG